MDQAFHWLGGSVKEGDIALATVVRVQALLHLQHLGIDDPLGDLLAVGVLEVDKCCHCLVKKLAHTAHRRYARCRYRAHSVLVRLKSKQVACSWSCAAVVWEASSPTCQPCSPHSLTCRLSAASLNSARAVGSSCTSEPGFFGKFQLKGGLQPLCAQVPQVSTLALACMT